MLPAAYSLSDGGNEESIHHHLFLSIKVAVMPRTSRPTMTIPLGALIHCIVECAGLFCSLKPFVLPTHLCGGSRLQGLVIQQTSQHVSCSLARHCLRREISAHLLSQSTGLVSRGNEFKSRLSLGSAFSL
jgi:hypothetical protein